MRSLVVLFAVIAAAVAAPQDLLEGHILNKRSLGHAITYSLPSAVSHQSRVDVRTSPAIVATAPVVSDSVVAEPAIIEARNLYSAPAATVYSTGAALSHQSRVDVRSSPAVVARSSVVTAPVVLTEPVQARSVYAPVETVYAGGSAVSHQSRLDVHSSPAVVTQEVVAPAVVEARSVWAPSVYSSTW